jgi:hypothetical protein
LVEGDDAAGHRGGDRGELFLAEADRQRQQRRAPDAGQAEREHAPGRAPVREHGDDHERAGEHERQDLVADANRDPSLESLDPDPPDRDHGPEGGECQ